MIKRPHPLDLTMTGRESGHGSNHSHQEPTPEQAAWIAATIWGVAGIPKEIIKPLGPVLQNLANQIGGP